MTPIDPTDLDFLVRAMRYRKLDEIAAYFRNPSDASAVARLCTLYHVDCNLPAWPEEMAMHVLRLQKLSCLI